MSACLDSLVVLDFGTDTECLMSHTSSWAKTWLTACEKVISDGFGFLSRRDMTVSYWKRHENHIPPPSSGPCQVRANLRKYNYVCGARFPSQLIVITHSSQVVDCVVCLLLSNRGRLVIQSSMVVPGKPLRKDVAINIVSRVRTVCMFA